MKKVLALDGIDIYETPDKKYYCVIRWSGSKSKLFNSILELINHYKL